MLRCSEPVCETWYTVMPLLLPAAAWTCANSQLAAATPVGVCFDDGGEEGLRQGGGQMGSAALLGLAFLFSDHSFLVSPALAFFNL